MVFARREVGALTRALQRCLPRRAPSFERDPVARCLLAVAFGAASNADAASVRTRCDAARTTQPSDKRTCARSTKRRGVAVAECIGARVQEGRASKEDAAGVAEARNDDGLCGGTLERSFRSV